MIKISLINKIFSLLILIALVIAVIVISYRFASQQVMSLSDYPQLYIELSKDDVLTKVELEQLNALNHNELANSELRNYKRKVYFSTLFMSALLFGGLIYILRLINKLHYPYFVLGLTLITSYLVSSSIFHSIIWFLIAFLSIKLKKYPINNINVT